jgi:cobalt/nickel transport system permease protein
MLSIDTYAYTNRFKSLHPLEKTIFSLVVLGICLAFSDPGLYIFVVFSMMGIISGWAGIPLRFYLKILAFPLPFVLLGVLTIICNFSQDPARFDLKIRVFSVFIGTTAQSAAQGLMVLLRTYACVSCLYFLSLTTPMVDIVWVMRKLRMPPVFIEILSIIYRFIFELLDTAFWIKTSQDARLGYVNFRKAMKSLGFLISNLFIKTFQNYKNLTTAMESRLYSGEFRVLEERFDFSIQTALLMGAYLAALFLLISIDWPSLPG